MVKFPLATKDGSRALSDLPQKPLPLDALEEIDDLGRH